MRRRREDPQGLVSGPRPLVVEDSTRTAAELQREAIQPTRTVGIGPRIRELLLSKLPKEVRLEDPQGRPRLLVRIRP